MQAHLASAAEGRPQTVAFFWEAGAIPRRDFLKAGIAVAGSGLLPASSSASGKRTVRWAFYQNLDLEADEMKRDGGIRAIYDGWFGSRASNWTLAILVANGAL